MNLQLSGHHVEISPALKAYAETKLERIVRHFDHIIEIAMILSIENPSEKDKRQCAEVNLRVKGNVFHAEHHAEDLYAAIDCVVDKLDRQLVKHKERLQDHKQEAAKYALS
jgi:putative sigma-54 modulation protein